MEQGLTWPETLWIVRHGESAGNVARAAALATHQPVIDIPWPTAPSRRTGSMRRRGATGGWPCAAPLRLYNIVAPLDAAGAAVTEERPDCLRALGGRAVLTPHAGEMAGRLGASEEEVGRDPLAVARQAASCWGAVVALKGPQTYVAAPDGAVYRYDGGGVGLATSGSGDTLAGIVAGLAARGADPLHAAVWGVYLHGAAGARLAQRLGPVGFLARELAAEIPSLLAAVEGGEETVQQRDGR